MIRYVKDCSQYNWATNSLELLRFFSWYDNYGSISVLRGCSLSLLCIDLLIFVLPDKIVITKLLKVLIILPKLEVVALRLEIGHLVKYAQVSSIVIRTESLRYLLQKLDLIFGQLVLGWDAIKVWNSTVFLYCSLKQLALALLALSLARCIWLTKIPDLVLFEGSHKGALVLFQNELGYKLAYPLHVDELDDVNLVLQLLRCSLVPLVLLEPLLVPVIAWAAKAAAHLEEPHKQVLLVGVPIASSFCDCAHHGMLSLSFSDKSRAILSVCVWLSAIDEVLGACRVNSTDERVFKLKGLIASEYDCKCAPDDPWETTDDT